MILNNRPQRISVSALALASALVCCGAAALPEASPVPHAGQQACWLEVDTGREACAPDAHALARLLASEFDTAIAGPEAEPDAAAPFALTTPPPTSVPLTATYILGIHYFDAEFSGTSRTITESVDANPCNQPGSYVFGFEGTLGSWDDQVSSFEGYGHCGFRFFADANFAGSTFGPSGSTTRMGAFNDQASSFDTHKVD